MGTPGTRACIGWEPAWSLALHVLYRTGNMLISIGNGGNICSTAVRPYRSEVESANHLPPHVRGHVHRSAFRIERAHTLANPLAARSRSVSAASLSCMFLASAGGSRGVYRQVSEVQIGTQMVAKAPSEILLGTHSLVLSAKGFYPPPGTPPRTNECTPRLKGEGGNLLQLPIGSGLEGAAGLAGRSAQAAPGAGVIAGLQQAALAQASDQQVPALRPR